MSPAYADFHSSGLTAITPEGFFQGLKLSQVNRATIKMFCANGKQGKAQKVKCPLPPPPPPSLLQLWHVGQLCRFNQPRLGGAAAGCARLC